jgi:hypothetical protein
MTRGPLELRLLERICCGEREAMEWLTLWSEYVHAIDDIVDKERDGVEDVLRTFARAVMLYSHPFYLKNLAALRAVVLVIGNLYADSVGWEKSLVAWQRNWSDHNRHAGMEMVIAVAQICGGYEHGRAISEEQRCICWAEHHDREGEKC